MGADVNFCVHCRSDEDCPDCEAEAAPVRKAAQVAAIRQRLGDMWLGAQQANADEPKQYGGFMRCVESVWESVFKTEQEYPLDLDALAAWLWERGVRG